MPQEVKKTLQTIGHEIAVEFAQQLLLRLMEYIDLDKNGKANNLGSLKGTQLFIEYPLWRQTVRISLSYIERAYHRFGTRKTVDNKYSCEIWEIFCDRLCVKKRYGNTGRRLC